MEITELRKYRFKFDLPPFNSVGDGIALFDFIITFLVARILEPYTRPVLGISTLAYYLMLLPLGVIVHVLTKQDTFLNRQLFTKSLNVYQIIIGIIIYKLYIELNR